MGNHPDIAVVIPTLNEAGTIAAVIASLLPAGGEGDRVRLFVADGGSRDGTRDIVSGLAASDPRIRLLHNPNRIQSAAVNLVARKVAETARWLVRCDAHATYPSGFVPAIVKALEDTGADSVVVPMDSVGLTKTGRAIAWVSDTRVGSGGSAHRGGRRSSWVDHGHHAGWKLSSFLDAGGYDEGFSHNEDAELDCRLRAAGGRVWLAGDIRMTYFVRSTFAALGRQYRAYGRGRSRTVRRHPASLRARQLLLPSAVSAIAIAAILGVFAPLFWLLPLAYVAILALVSAVGAKRIGAAGWRSGMAAATMHGAWTMGFLEGLVSIRQPRWPGYATMGRGQAILAHPERVGKQ